MNVLGVGPSLGKLSDEKKRERDLASFELLNEATNFVATPSACEKSTNNNLGEECGISLQ